MTEKTRKVKRLSSGGKGGIIELALEHGRKPIIGGKDAAIVPIAHEVTPDHGTELLDGVILRFTVSGVEEFLLFCAAVYLGFIVSVALTSALMDTLIFTLILVVIFVLFSLTLFIYPVRIRRQFQQIMDESGKSFFDDDIYAVIDEMIS